MEPITLPVWYTSAVEDSWKKVVKIGLKTMGVELCKKLLELTPGLDDYCENMFENGMEGMQEYCHMIAKATNTIVYMIHNTHWLKCLSSEMNFIEGVEIEGYYALEEAIIETMQSLLKTEFNAHVRKSWQKFYQFLHLLPLT
ncbi:uncharacterized protein [Dysidea avara]